MDGMRNFVADAVKVLSEQSWSLSAPAKINLRLKVLGRRRDGYHILSMLNASVSLFDEVTLQFDSSLASSVQCLGSELMEVETRDNLVFRAYELFWRVCGLNATPFPVQAVVDKHIPVGGGLGGGSSDAAALLRFLTGKLGPLLEEHEIIAQSVFEEKLFHAALKLGADVPYALNQGVCWVQGVGECVSRVELHELRKLVLVLTVPRETVPTRDFYDFYRLNKVLLLDEFASDEEMAGVHSGEAHTLSNLFSNDFEPYIRNFRPQTGELLDVAREFFPISSFTGSGSVFFSVVIPGSEQRISDYRSAVEKFGADLKIVKVL